MKIINKKYNIIFIHGWLFDSKIWFGLDRLFSKDYKTLTIDLPGYGKNKDIKDTSLDYCNKIFQKTDKPTVLIGWSLGGVLALLSLQKKIPNIKKLILINSPLLNNELNELNSISLSKVEKLKEDLLNNRDNALNSFLFECVKGSKNYIHEFKIIKQYFNTSIVPNNNILIESLDELYYIENDLSLLNKDKKILIINSKNDKLVINKNKKFSDSSNLNIKVLENSGHVPFITYNKELYRIIKEFLDK